MIFKTMLNIMATITTILINIVNEIIPETNLGTSINDIITTILTITQQGLNFMYLIFGDTFFIVMGILPSYLLFKFIVPPMFMIVRGILINSTE